MDPPRLLHACILHQGGVLVTGGKVLREFTKLRDVISYSISMSRTPNWKHLQPSASRCYCTLKIEITCDAGNWRPRRQACGLCRHSPAQLQLWKVAFPFPTSHPALRSHCKPETFGILPDKHEYEKSHEWSLSGGNSWVTWINPEANTSLSTYVALKPFL